MNRAKFFTCIYFAILFFSCPVICYAQVDGQGTTLLLTTDAECSINFDGDSLGVLAANSVKKVKAGMGDHILIATYAGDKFVRKIIKVITQKQMIIAISAPKNTAIANDKRTKTSDRPIRNGDKKLTKEEATELFKSEMSKISPDDIGKLKYYLTKGVDPRTRGKQGWSLLHEAAFQGDTALIRFCLANGLPIDARSVNSSGLYTPLSCAVDQGHLEAVQLLLKNNATYGTPDGYGEIEYDSSNKYKGDIKDGKKNGQGTFYYSNGTVYVGEWAKDKQNGRGILTFPNGVKSEGDFKDGYISGLGTTTYSGYGTLKGDKYVGHYENDMFSGKGVYYFANGNRYEGNFRFGIKSGFGTFFSSDSDKYEGNWASDMKNGQGTQYLHNGDKYVGNWENNKMNGIGILYWADGSRYEGHWSEGLQNGEGTCYFSNGSKYVGNWMDGLENGQGTYSWAGGDKYEGNCSNGKRSGKGIYYFANGDVYNGEWEEGVKSGYGIMTIGSNNTTDVTNCADCKIYKGYWLNDVKEGDGGCYDKTGNLIYEGKFINDHPTGKYPNH